MKTFRDIVTESPVGSRGRTGKIDAQAHIEASGLEKEFIKVVKKLGGKTVARELLSRMNTKSEIVSPEGDKTLAEKKAESPAKYLRDSGYKIKSEEPTKNGSEIEFFKDKDAKSAKEDLEGAGFGDAYSFSLAGKFLEYIVS